MKVREGKFKDVRQPGRKYKNKPVSADGKRFDSTFEHQVYQDLVVRELAGEFTQPIRTQQRIQLKGENGTVVAHYKIDFVVYRKDGVAEYIEAKGFPTPEWKIKWELLKDQMKNCADVELRLLWLDQKKQWADFFKNQRKARG